MKTVKRTLMLLTILAVATASVAAPSPAVQVTLTIRNEALAGLSVPLNIRVRNQGAVVELAPTVSVRATSPTGETFTASWGEHIEAGELELGLTDEDAETLNVKPNSTIDLEVPAATLTDNSWASDPRIAGMPGKWTLQVLLFSERDRSCLVSNAATLIVNAPQAKDVWIAEALARGEMWSIAERVFTEQPESPYFPYISTAVRRLSTLERIDIINRAITLHSDSPVVPRLRYDIAEYYAAAADRVFAAERDLEKAVALAERGRAELVRLKNSNDVWSKLKGSQREDDFPSRAGYVELLRLQPEKGVHKQ